MKIVAGKPVVNKLLELINDEPTDPSANISNVEAVVAALNTIEAMVATYTRDRHVTRTGAFKNGIESVLVTAAARLLANPGQVAVQFSAGSLSVRKGAGFNGFTLAELMTLDRYRKRGI